jgi:hypothetical protein
VVADVRTLAPEEQDRVASVILAYLEHDDAYAML